MAFGHWPPTAYLAGPMRGIAEFNFPLFIQAANEIRSWGWQVVSPAEHDLQGGFNPRLTVEEQDWSLEDAFRWDVEQVLAADAVIVLPGWELSRGASIEVSVAHAIGVPVIEFETFRIVEAAA